jgi:hypothetical protein
MCDDAELALIDQAVSEKALVNVRVKSAVALSVSDDTFSEPLIALLEYICDCAQAFANPC